MAARALCLLLVGLPCTVTHAQSGDATESAGATQSAGATESANEPEPAFDGVQIIAREPGASEVVPEDYTGSRSAVDPATLRRRDIGVGDVLAREAGLQQRRSGGFGSFASITVRAADASQTAILLDGIRLNSAGNPVVDLATLDLLSLDGIDVYRGITPIEFGPGAIGGAIALSTPRLPAGAAGSTRLGVGVGSFGYRRIEGARLGRNGRWDSVISASLTRADNDFGFDNDNGTPLNRDDDRRERRSNADAHQAGLLAKLGTTHGNGARTDTLLQLGQRRLGVPELRNRSDNRARFDTDTLQLHLRHAHRPGAGWQAVHTGYAHAQQDHFDDRLSQVGLGRQDTRSRSRTLGTDSAWRRSLGGGTLGVKAEARLETLASRDRIRLDQDVDARRERVSLGTQYSLYPGDGRWVVSPAINVRHDRDRFELERDRASGKARRNDTDVAPAIGVRFDQTETHAWHASLSRYSRQPSFGELFIDRGLLRGNPDLMPERGINLDLGVDLTLGASRVAKGADDDRPTARSAADAFAPGATLSATVFASERDEQIVTVFDARGVGRAENAGQARVLGLELTLRLVPIARWSLDMNLTLQDAANRSANPVIDGRQLPGEARLAAFAAIGFQPAARWRLRLETELLRERFYDQANRRRAADTTLLHAGLFYTTPRWRTALSLTNLGDRQVEDFNGFPRPGRGAVLSFHFTPGTPS